MRRAEKRADEEVAWAILSRARVVWVSAVDPDGLPLLRPLHGVVVDGRLCFHAAPAGEKLAAVGQPVVAMAEETLAAVPSTFTSPHRACPATTFYRSASVHGTLRELVDPHTKARVLQALMERFQPEGGYRPITADDPMYAAAVRGLAVLTVDADRVVAKRSVAQHKRAAHRGRVIEQLWDRGAPGDARAAQEVFDAAPLEALPPRMQGPHGTRLVLAAGEDHVDGAVELLRDQYWNDDVDDARLRAAQLASQVWMVLLQGERVVGTARALTDGVKTSYVVDVAVAEDQRGRGLGRFLVTALRRHPGLRATRVDLLTRTAGPFYEALGFAALTSAPWRHAGDPMPAG